MRALIRRAGWTTMFGVMFGVLALARPSGAQQAPPAAEPPPTWMADVRFERGREVVPYYEGWIRNADGTYDLVFGYFNRNTEQEFVLPVGPLNMFSPGETDRGQPTYFMTRRQPRIFRVRVAKDVAEKGVTWSLTTNGRTEKVVARLVPGYEKDEQFIITGNNTTIVFGEDDVNQPPTMTLVPVKNARVNVPVVLSAAVTDDGLPKPRARMDDPDRPQEATAPDPLARFKSQRNSSGPARLTGPRVTWQIFRGPGLARIDSTLIPVTNGKADTTAVFTTPGTYVLLATAGDGKLNTFQRLTIDVR